MKKLLMLMESLSREYPSRLEDGYEIAEYIESVSPDYVDEEAMEEYFNGAYAELEVIPIDSIKEGNSDHNLRDEDKEKEYSKMSVETMPPIVVEGGVVVDGNHRFRVAKQLGAKKIRAYIVKD